MELGRKAQEAVLQCQYYSVHYLAITAIISRLFCSNNDTIIYGILKREKKTVIKDRQRI